jgi:hypothetical protein
MTSQMMTGLIGVLAALGGTTIGGLITYFTNRDLKKKEWELSILREEINDRKTLYSSFLAEAYRLLLISYQTKYGDLKEFTILNRYLAQIELLADDEVVKEAMTIVDHVITNHSQRDNDTDKDFYISKANFINEVKQERHRLINSR